MLLTDLSAPIERLSETVLASCRGDEEAELQFNAECSSLGRMLAAVRAGSNQTEAVREAVAFESERMHNYEQDVNVQGVMEAVDRAGRDRVEKVEHEAMAKLVNRLRDRRDLVKEESQAQSTIASLQSESLSLDGIFETKKSTAHQLLTLVEAVRNSLDVEPASPDLPPLSEVDPSLFDL